MPDQVEAHALTEGFSGDPDKCMPALKKPIFGKCLWHQQQQHLKCAAAEANANAHMSFQRGTKMVPFAAKFA